MYKINTITITTTITIIIIELTSQLIELKRMTLK